MPVRRPERTARRHGTPIHHRRQGPRRISDGVFDDSLVGISAGTAANQDCCSQPTLLHEFLDIRGFAAAIPNTVPKHHRAHLTVQSLAAPRDAVFNAGSGADVAYQLGQVLPRSNGRPGRAQVSRVVTMSSQADRIARTVWLQS